MTRYTITTGGELGSDQMVTDNQAEVVEYIKEFVRYARGSRDLTPGALVYNDYRHFSEITIRGTQRDLEALDKLITKKDWSAYEN